MAYLNTLIRSHENQMLFGDSPESIVSENDDIDSEERAGIVRSELTSALICGELERRGKLY